MFVGFLVAMAVASQIPQFREMFDGSSEPLGLMLAAGVMFVVGALDDLRDGVAAGEGRGAWCSRGSLLSLFGVTMLYFRVPFAGSRRTSCSRPTSRRSSPCSTVVVFANAINLIDGLDGLAAGIVAIAGTALFLYADRLFKAGLLEGSNIAPLVAMIAVGMCVGFLPHNFNPAKIFMGDAGALFLGLLMATTTITVGGRTADQFSGQTYFFFAPLFIPIVILGIPIIDTAFSFFRRVYTAHCLPRRRQGPPAPPAHAARPRPPAGPSSSSGCGRRCSRARPAPHVHEPGERHRPARDRSPGPRALRRVPSRRPLGPRGRPRSRRPRPLLGEDVVDLAARRSSRKSVRGRSPAVGLGGGLRTRLQI